MRRSVERSSPKAEGLPERLPEVYVRRRQVRDAVAVVEKEARAADPLLKVVAQHRPVERRSWQAPLQHRIVDLSARYLDRALRGNW